MLGVWGGSELRFSVVLDLILQRFVKALFFKFFAPSAHDLSLLKSVVQSVGAPRQWSIRNGLMPIGATCSTEMRGLKAIGGGLKPIFFYCSNYFLRTLKKYPAKKNLKKNTAWLIFGCIFHKISIKSLRI